MESFQILKSTRQIHTLDRLSKRIKKFYLTIHLRLQLFVPSLKEPHPRD